MTLRTIKNRFPEWIALGTALLMPLVFWPASPQPFSAAKDWILAVWVLTGFAGAAAAGLLKRKLPVRVSVAMAVWIIALSFSAGTGEVASFRELVRNLFACAGMPLLIWIAPSPRRFVFALSLSGTVVASLALLQWAGLDPFQLLNLTGSLQGNSRIRIFSTLGNPNFVAAFLTTVLPLTIFLPAESDSSGRAWSWYGISAGILQASAILATGSRAPILGILAAGFWLLMCRAHSRWRWLLSGTAVCCVLLLFSPARSLEKTAAGRIYIWRIAVSHISEIPAAGYGPGAFAVRYAQWETDHIRSNPNGPDSVFSGFQDHAHNDYVEFLVDYGIVGFCAFLFAVAFAAPILIRRARSPLPQAVGAAYFALLAIAFVDFPLHRPAELYLFWTLPALLWILVDRQRPVSGS